MAEVDSTYYSFKCNGIHGNRHPDPSGDIAFTINGKWYGFGTNLNREDFEDGVAQNFIFALTNNNEMENILYDFEDVYLHTNTKELIYEGDK